MNNKLYFEAVRKVLVAHNVQEGTTNIVGIIERQARFCDMTRVELVEEARKLSRYFAAHADDVERCLDRETNVINNVPALQAKLTAQCSALYSMLFMAGEIDLTDAFRVEVRKALPEPKEG